MNKNFNPLTGIEIINENIVISNNTNDYSNMATYKDIETFHCFLQAHNAENVSIGQYPTINNDYLLNMTCSFPVYAHYFEE